MILNRRTLLASLGLTLPAAAAEAATTLKKKKKMVHPPVHHITKTASVKPRHIIKPHPPATPG